MGFTRSHIEFINTFESTIEYNWSNHFIIIYLSLDEKEVSRSSEQCFNVLHGINRL